jgi:hypothetical protein
MSRLRRAIRSWKSTAQRLGDALKFHQEAVACGLDDAALALGDRRIDQLKPHGFEPGQRPSFVDFH